MVGASSWMRERRPFVFGALFGILVLVFGQGLWAWLEVRSADEVFFDSLEEIVESQPVEVREDIRSMLMRMTELGVLVQREHISKTLSPQVVSEMMNGALESLDEFSSFIDVDEAEPLLSDEDLDHRRQIGLLIAPEVDVYRVESIVAGSPSEESGILPGDRVVRLAGTDVGNVDPYTINEKLVELLADESRVSINIGVERPGVAEILSFAVRPADIEPASAFDLGVENGVLHVLVSGFYPGVADEVAFLVARARREAPLEGIILDLRNNGGGLTSEAQKLAELFLPHGSLLYEARGRSVDVEQVRTRTAPLFPDLGLVALVNGASASASEIVAAAIQVHKRGKVVGWQTYGKGTVQRIFPTYHGAIKITAAEYFDAGLRRMDKIGVSPNLVMDMPDPLTRPSRFEADRARDMARKIARGLQ